MAPNIPILRSQTKLDIYQEALSLARKYCKPDYDDLPEGEDYFDPDDPGLIMLKLFSEMTEFLLTQTNRIPDKYQLAFLDFIGLKLLPPRPAVVPLTFSLSEGASGAYVPAKICVASSEDPSIVFETSQDLSVVAMGLEAVFSINPCEDEYTEHQDALKGKDDGFSIFGGDVSEKKLDHILYLGDDILLDIRRKTKIDICITGKNLFEKYFSCWVDVNNNPLEIIPGTPPDTPTQITVSLCIPKLEKASVNEFSSFWIAVKPEKDVKIVIDQQLPEISKIKASISVDKIIPDMVFFNDIQVDPKKGFYPFGEEPKIGDTLYIGSEALSQKGACISFHIEALKKEKPKNPTLKWEYWSGNAWESLSISKCEPDVIIFEDSCSIKFRCPLIHITEINGQRNWWIRVRIDSGDYGTAGSIIPKDVDKVAAELASDIRSQGIKDLTDDLMINAFHNKKINTEFECKNADFDPPFVKGMIISYKLENNDFNKKITYNNFVFEDLKNKPFIPCKAVDDKLPALYLGFKENLSNVPLTFFFAVKEQLSNEEKEIYSELSWEFSEEDTQTKKDTFTRFTVKDETESFRREGIISFSIPSNIEEILKFGKRLYWIRARVTDSIKTRTTNSVKTNISDLKTVSYPKLKGIFPNTVLASNVETVCKEVLGSGNGEPGLSLFFSKRPILEGQIIKVKESAIPSSNELNTVEEGTLWTETRDFSLSDPISRHYMLDRANGEITFGDGTHGMIPPRGKNNIIAELYQSGGGERGDVVAGVLTSLKTTIPYVESVVNKVPSAGGKDQENLESVKRRGSHTLKNGGRAVTVEDFEWLSYEASPYVAKVKCFSAIKEDDMYPINVFIVPKSEEDEPYPETGLMASVEMYLKERALITISDKISVQGPKYKHINAKVSFKPLSQAQSIIVKDKIIERVKRFLHPLRGGQDEKGWDFGQAIFISELAAVVEDLEGVDYVTSICLQKESEPPKCGIDHIAIGSYSLPSAGDVIVIVEE